MSYFELIDDVAIPGRWHVGEITDAAGAVVGFRQSVRVDPSDSLTGSVYHGMRPLDFFLTSFGVPIVTKELGGAIKRIASEEVQLLALKLSNGIRDYVVLNATRRVECLDETRSTFLKWTEADERPDLMGGYRQVTKLRIKSALVPAHAQMFRIKGWEIALIVSETVKQEMQRAGCFGARFEYVG